MNNKIVNISSTLSIFKLKREIAEHHRRLTNVENVIAVMEKSVDDINSSDGHYLFVNSMYKERQELRQTISKKELEIVRHGGDPDSKNKFDGFKP